MKKLYLPLLLLCLAFTSKAQTYYPMFGYDHYWYVNYYAEGSSTRETSTFYNELIYHSNSDTVINNKIYYKTNLSGIIQYYGPVDTNVYFREDTTAKQVWILTKDTTKENLIYDYSLQTGDSVYLTFNPADSPTYYAPVTGWFFVDSVKTVSIYAGPRKALFLTNPKKSYDTDDYKTPPVVEWIEQVGSPIMPDYSQQLIDGDVGFENFWNYAYILLCSFDTSNKIYHSHALDSLFIQFTPSSYEDSDSCSLHIFGGINRVIKPNLFLQLSPNPSTNNIQLTTTLPHPSITQVFIYNIYGQIVYSSATPASSINFQSTINVTQLTAGIYFVRLSVNDSAGLSSFVKE